MILIWVSSSFCCWIRVKTCQVYLFYISLQVTVAEGEILKPRFSKGVQVKYRVYMDKNLTETPLIKNTLKPKFKHSKVFSFDKITKEHLDFFESGSITFLVYGIQEDTVPDPKLLKYTTRVSKIIFHSMPCLYDAVREGL